ncbi:class I SAM-dependent DNA methyltransferase [Nannocystaceae bacterium ST9]
MSVEAATLQRLRGFIEAWKDRPVDDPGGFQRFFVELCQALATAAPTGSDYQFDREVPGAEERGAVDVYKHGHFMMEAKRARASTREQGSTPVRGDALAYTQFIRAAYVNQLFRYRRALVDPPPLLIVVDIGHRLWIWPAFDDEVPDFWSPERIELAFAELAEPRNAEILLACFERPELLDRRRRRAAVSEVIATRLAKLVRELERRHPAAEVADFAMRVLFCLFADSAGLLPPGLMRELCTRAVDAPEGAAIDFTELFATMREGGRLRGHALERFGPEVIGAHTRALPLAASELGLLAELCELDWQHLDPAIFGTLLEQALDERERWRLGAHYTPRAHVERLVATTLEPLEEQWRAVQAHFGLRCAALGSSPTRQRLEGLVRATLVPFHEQLVGLRVLDPACGTGNFLTVAHQRVAAIEHEYRTLIGQLFGDQQVIEESLSVMPDRFVGLEKSAWAAEIAQLVLFIGHVQVWLERTGIGPIAGHERGRRAKVIAALATCRRSIRVADAVLDEQGGAPEWPSAEYIVGNPPYVGNKQMREALGSDYVDRLRRAYPELPQSIDLVMFWWHRAARALASGECRRVGLITTNSIRQVQNRPVVRAALDGEPPLRLAWAIADHPWIDRGAQVRIAMMVVERSHADDPPARLGAVIDERGDRVELRFTRVAAIHADFQAELELEQAEPLQANEGVCFQGMNLVGKDGFVLSAEQVAALGYRLDDRPPVIRPYLGGREFLHARRGEYVIDAHGLSERELAEDHPRLHAWLAERVRPERERNARATYRDRWWVFGEPRGRLRAALRGLGDFIVTNETARVRTFERVDVETVPDHQLYAIASDDPFVLGVLMSIVHRAWALAKGGRQGVGNDPRYNSTQCFSTFPFPDPSPSLRDRIAAQADAIDVERKLMRAEHPRWTLAKIHAQLLEMHASREIVELRLAALLDRVERLDNLVGQAYGLATIWADCGRRVDDAAILSMLLRLNRQRRTEERAGRVRWLVPELAPPGAARQQSFADAIVEAPEPAARAGRDAWPRDPVARLLALARALARAEAPLHRDDLVRLFHRARPQVVARLLASLASLGFIEESENRWSLVGRMRSLPDVVGPMVGPPAS